MSNPEHHFNVTVYYSDTDAGGVVYFPNYVTFMENARQEMMREAGFLFPPFVFCRSDIKVNSPAHLTELLTVVTQVMYVGKSRLDLAQKIFRDMAKRPLVEMTTTLAYVNFDDKANPKACPMPPELRKALIALCADKIEHDD